MDKCFLCENECESQRDAGRRGGCDFYSCSNCGRYYTIDFFTESYKSLTKDNKRIISGYLYKTNRKTTNVVDLTKNEMERILMNEKIPHNSMKMDD